MRKYIYLFPLILLSPVLVAAQITEWARGISNSYLSRAEQITTDAKGNVYVVGFFRGTIDLDPGPAVASVTATGSSQYILKLDPAGKLIWYHYFSGDSYPKFPGASYAQQYIQVDKSNYVYIAGNINTRTNFDPGATDFKLSPSGTSDCEQYMAKLAPDGAFVWAKPLAAGCARGRLNGFILDHSDNPIFCGSYMDLTDFDPGPDELYLNISSPTEEEAFVSKLDKNGNLQWVAPIRGISGSEAFGLAVDQRNNVYCSGEFFGDPDFDPGTATHRLGAAERSGIYLVRYSDSGSFDWAKKIDGEGQESCRTLSINPSGHLFFSGFFAKEADFDPNSGVFKLSSGGRTNYICEWDTAGKFHNARVINSNTYFSKTSVDSRGNFYNTGDFTGTVDFSTVGSPRVLKSQSPGNDMFVAKYDTSLNLVWCRQFGAASPDEWVFSLHVDNGGGLYFAGSFQDSVNLHLGSASLILKGSNPDANSGFFFKANQCLDPLKKGILVTGSRLESEESAASGFQWIDCAGGIAIPGATAKAYTPARSGSYAVLLSRDHCADTSDCVFVWGTGIEESAYADNVSLYPNPSSTYVTVKVPDQRSSLQVDVFSAEGVLVQQQEFRGQTTILTDAVPGLYFVRIRDSDGHIRHLKVLKQ